MQRPPLKLEKKRLCINIHAPTPTRANNNSTYKNHQTHHRSHRSHRCHRGQGKRQLATVQRRRRFRILYAISDCLLLRHRENTEQTVCGMGCIWKEFQLPKQKHLNALEHLLACFTRHKLKFINILCTTCVNVSPPSTSASLSLSAPRVH